MPAPTRTAHAVKVFTNTAKVHRTRIRSKHAQVSSKAPLQQYSDGPYYDGPYYAILHITGYREFNHQYEK